MSRKIICLIIVIFHAPVAIYGQNDRYFMLNNIKARPLAMGGAFVSIADDLASAAYNPAAYLLDQLQDTRRWAFFVNPISPFVGGIENQELFQGSGPAIDDILLSLSLLVKSISFRFDSFQLGVLLGEESLYHLQEFDHASVFNVAGFRQNHSHAIVGRLKLAEKVSMGGAANFLFSSSKNDPLESNREFALSYGILLRPEKGLNIGVSFVNLPDSLQQYRLALERIVDESVNIGISYELFTGTLFSLDVRNLGEEQQNVVREFHFGLEQMVSSQLALRAGYFNKEKGQHVFSWGLGLFHSNLLFNTANKVNRNFVLNYAFVYERSSLADNRWHFLSCFIKI